MSRIHANSFEGALDLVLEELRSIMISKQRDYGSENITKFGEYGVLVRCHDKMARLINLINSGQAPNNESIEDSWKDLANYAIIALMIRYNIWGLPFGEGVISGKTQ